MKKDLSSVSPERRQAWFKYKKELKARQNVKRSVGYVFARDLNTEREILNGEPASAAKFDSFVEEDEPTPLFVYEPNDLCDFQLDEVQIVWERRTELCGTLEAAAEVLAILRLASGADSSYLGWRRYLSHEMILALKDELPRLDSDESFSSETNDRDLSDMLTDRRQVAIRNIKLRSGQSHFREEILAFHHGRCCVTGCAEPVLLEAAHIVPYMGAHSHDVQNGLCLRVDIHRLFDAHLISINPESFEIVVSKIIKDKAYLALAGRRLFRSGNAPNRSYLHQHFNTFTVAKR